MVVAHPLLPGHQADGQLDSKKKEIDAIVRPLRESLEKD